MPTLLYARGPGNTRNVFGIPSNIYREIGGPVKYTRVRILLLHNVVTSLQSFFRIVL